MEKEIKIDRNRTLTSPAKRAVVLAVMVAVGWLPTIVQAQSVQEASASGRIEEVVVSAQRRLQSAQDVPVAITVLSGDRIDNSYFNNLEGLQHSVPSLNFRKGNTTRNSALFLRGVGTISFSTAAEPSVSTIVDGIVYARSGMAFQDLFDVAQIEVLRGPQGTLFGKNASAGALNITTRRPEQEFGGSVDIAGFEDDEYRASAAINLPITDTLRARINGTFREFDGFVKNRFSAGRFTNLNRSSIIEPGGIPNDTPDARVNGYSTKGVRGILEWDADPRLNFTVIADWTESNDDCCAPIVGQLNESSLQIAAIRDAFADVDIRGDETRAVAQNLVTRTLDESWGVSLQWNYELPNEWTLTSISAYREWDNTEIREGDNFPGTLTAVRTPQVDGNGFFTGNTIGSFGLFELHDLGPQSWETYQQEFRLASPSGGRFDWQVGAFYFNVASNRSFTRFTTICTDSQLAPIDTRTITDAGGAQMQQLILPCETAFDSDLTEATATARFSTEFENVAGFAQGNFHVNDQWTLTGGLRLTYDDISFKHARVNPTGIAAPGIRPANFQGRGSTDNTELTGEFSVQYNVSQDVMPYVKYSRGYKGPAFNTFFNMIDSDTLPIGEETADAFELGVKTSLLDNRLIFNVTGFYAAYEDFQANNNEFLPDGSQITRLTNAGDIETTGIEIDFTAMPLENLILTGGLAYTSAEIDKFNTLPGQEERDRSGESLPFAPDWSAHLNVDYLWVIPNFGFDISLQSDYSYKSSQLTNLGNTASDFASKVDSFHLWNANIGFVSKDEKYRLSFLIRNILDDNFATMRGQGGNFAQFFTAREADRHFGVAFRAHF